MSSDQNIKVAVRVRPFNQREKKLASTCCLQMMDQHTIMQHPTIEGHNKTFTFDYSYWSFDDSSSSFATNESIYSDVGRDCLEAAFDGYNVSIFAYGQTGAGKSFSMVGYGPDRGIIPRLCDDMFQRLEDTQRFDVFKVQVSMLEIYNERIRDLLVPKSSDLKVRETPDRRGFEVVDLVWKPAKSYAQIEQLMEEGTKNRTVGSTAMNATSSRAHTIFSIRLEFTKADSAVTHSTKVSLVDLAGSERAKNTEASGARLKEGASINKSLSVLGTVIATLAEHSAKSSKKKTKGKPKPVRAPYRDSKLTMLLKESLGGNAKTVMIAALSPSSECYEETMSTLRFASRVKNIKKEVKINIDPKQAQVKNLQAQIKKLTEELSTAQSRRKSLSVQAHVQALQKQLEQNEEYFLEKQQEWEEKLRISEQETAERKVQFEELEKRRQLEPRLINLHEDPQMSEVIQHFIPEGTTRVCRPDAEPQPSDTDIVIDGLKIEKEHCQLEFNSVDKSAVVTPSSNASIFVNGKLVHDPTELHDNDRIVFGVHHVFRCQIPWEASDATDEPVVYDWKFAQKELSAAMMASLSVQSAESDSVDGSATEVMSDRQRARIKLEENLLQAVQLVRQVNGICEELSQNVSFSVRLRSIQKFDTNGKRQQEAQVIIHAMDYNSSNEAMFALGEFESRFFDMQESHLTWISQGRDLDGVDTSAFVIAAQHQTIGIARVYLRPIYHLFSVNEELPVINFSGENEGGIFVVIRPIVFDEDENDVPFEVDEDGMPVYSMESMDYLKGHQFRLSIEIQRGHIPLRLSCETHCKYHFYNDENVRTTCQTSSATPEWKHLETVNVDSLSDDLIRYFENGVIEIEVFGRRPSDEDLELIQRTSSDVAATSEAREQLYTIAQCLDFSSGESIELEDVVDEINSLHKRINKLEKQLKKAKSSQKAQSSGSTHVSIVPQGASAHHGLDDLDRPPPIVTGTPQNGGRACCSML